MPTRPMTNCAGCGAPVPDTDGPTHAYIGASPGCWAIYGQVLAREYSDPRYFAAHRLTVDAYAAQHPGEPSRRSTQSVAIHLISLYLVLDCDREPRWVTRRMQTLANGAAFHWLEPPPALGEVTVLDVLAATDAAGHIEAVRRWAQSVWQAWSPHHATIRAWASEDSTQRPTDR